MHTLNIAEVRAIGKIRVGVDISVTELKGVDIILWNWAGLYGIIPKPIVETAKDFIQNHLATLTFNKNRPPQLEFTWAQVREINKLVAETLKGL